MPNEVIASLQKVSKRYGAIRALDEVSMALRAGEVVALLGANGAGKTTAVSHLLGLIDPDEGEARLFGGRPGSLAARRRIGAMLQISGVPDTLRVDELIALFASYYANPHPLARVAEYAGVEDFLDRRYGKLSGGQQRRVQFALALVGQPRALFLDEPTVGLDIEARQAFWQVIREQVQGGCAVLLTTHYLEEAEALADRVVVLSQGRVIADDTIGNLRARTGQRLIACQTRIPLQVLATWPGVSDVGIGDDGRMQAKASDAEAIVRRLLDEDRELSGLEIRRAGLAETFVELTREAA